MSPSTEQGPAMTWKWPPPIRAPWPQSTTVSAVGPLEGLGHALDVVDDVHALDEIGVDLGGVADEADDGDVLALGDVGLEALGLDPVDELVDLAVGGAAVECNNHVIRVRFRVASCTYMPMQVR